MSSESGAVQENDYTEMRAGSWVRGYRIVKCPKCGRKGAEHKMAKGWRIYVHKDRLTVIGAGTPVTEQTDACTIQPPPKDTPTTLDV